MHNGYIGNKPQDFKHKEASFPKNSFPFSNLMSQGRDPSCTEANLLFFPNTKICQSVPTAVLV